MKIKKVGDRPMVIHTKKKATLHTHRKREVSIKGSGVYTVRKGPKVVGSTISDSRLYRSASERIKAKARRQYRKSTVHDTDTRDMRVSGFKRRIHESNMSIKTKKTNLHIAGVAAAKAATDQLEGGSEIRQAAGIAYEFSRPAMGASSKGAELLRRGAIVAKQKRIKQVKAGKKLARRTVRKAATDAGKKAAKESAKESAKLEAKISAKAAGTAAGAAAGPEGAVMGYAVGEAVGKKLDNLDYKATQRNRMIKFFLDKTKAEGEQTDSLPKLMKDLAKKKAMMWVKSAGPVLGIALISLVLIVFVAVIPAVTVTTVLYNSPFAVLMPSLEEGDTVISVSEGYVNDFKSKVQRLADEHTGYDEGELIYVDYEGMATDPTNLYDVIAVYMVKHGVGETATLINDTTKNWIKEVVNDMCTYTTYVKTKRSGDSTIRILQVKVTLKSYRDMITEYRFDEDQVSMLTELMSPSSLEAMGYTGFDIGGDPGVCSLTEEEINAVLEGITDATQKRVISFALHRVGYPYSQDRRDSGDYYDCSSLAFYSWLSVGVNMTYENSNCAAQEAKGLVKAGKTVTFAEMQPGDLIFYSGKPNGRYKNICHVAIYAGSGKLIEARNEKWGVVYADCKNKSNIAVICRPGD